MIINANAAFSSSYYLRNFYSSNRDAAQTANYRSNSSNHTLVLADSEAVQKAVKAISSIDYDSSDSEESSGIYNGITAFVSAYNNLVDSSSSSEHSYIKNKKSSLKAFVKEYESELKDVGITVNRDGTLEIDEDTFEGASLKKLKKIFSESEDFCNCIQKYAKSIQKYESNQITSKNISTDEDLTAALNDALNNSQINLLL